jgi:hypothetical protein
MHDRCRNPRARKYPLYGARGITVCKRWASFEAFLSDMGEKPDGLSIERLDNLRGYEPNNCKWATPVEQANNTRRNRRLTFRGETLTLTAWARRLGLYPSTLHERLGKMSVEGALGRKKGRWINKSE